MKIRVAPRLAVLVAACALLPGCFQKTTPWDPIGGRYDSGNWFGARFALDLPPDWMMMNFVEDGLVATRDGFNLQAVKVRKIKFGEDLPHTKKKVSKGMAPQELAEVLLDDLRSDGTANALKVSRRGLSRSRARGAFERRSPSRTATGCATRRSSAASWRRGAPGRSPTPPRRATTSSETSPRSTPR